MDDQFLHLVNRKIRARPARAMETTIKKQTLRKLFGSLWEKKIKPRFDGSNDFHQEVPVEMMTPAELRQRRDQPGDADPTIEFTAYGIQHISPPFPDSLRHTRIRRVFI